MKQIPLTKGKVALVDDEDYEWLSQWKWHVHWTGANWYAMRWIYKPQKQRVYMHRQIMGLQIGDKNNVDHADRNTFNNQKCNLRLCNQSQNIANAKKWSHGKTSNYKGVNRDQPRNKWRARIAVNKKEIFLGRFDSEIDAARVYDKAAVKYFGEFARLNCA